MNSTTAHRAGLVAVGLVTGLVVSAAPALAAGPAGIASVGFVDFTKDGKRVSLPTQAPCAVDGATSNSAAAADEQPGLRFGGGTSSCTTRAVDGDRTETTSEATGQGFELSALMSEGGPRLKIGSWHAVCVGKESGTDAGWKLDAISGFSGLPSEIPGNYVHQVKNSKDVVLANVTFSEVVLPEPNDGGIGINAVHFRFTPESGVTGEIVLGAAACSPTP
ncbi:hypothetical protein [Umezawaea sp. Da 62-37]|uniref:hypothetical protein n=1 Tax=Umezawaea sp. Da 62-37 TaxID=3075927 RepID=UPI0028F71E35|nr:hypothetical protein [Umezawaea sp. Da 62-37]WNV82730.1 hypothetical protein RM788_31615 [Umezawaea sp. Da 62-37]